jgi:hypothetical protein
MCVPPASTACMSCYICVFSMILTVNRDDFLKQRFLDDLCNGEALFFTVRAEILNII